MMTNNEQCQLDELLAIAQERDTPLREREIDFLQSLDGRRDREMTEKQADWFDDLVCRHLRGE